MEEGETAARDDQGSLENGAAAIRAAASQAPGVKGACGHTRKRRGD